ncbi:hypothetical protein BVAD3_41490 (plasmid) [Bacillus velezensis]|nr:hypothetical protein BVAD3_41490 [Bacillus velezensis]
MFAKLAGLTISDSQRSVKRSEPARKLTLIIKPFRRKTSNIYFIQNNE